MSGAFLIIGCGSIGVRHIENLLGLGISDIMAFDISQDRLEIVQKKYPVRGIKTLDAGWRQKPVAVLVTTPSSLHIPIALEAAERDFRLFIEKPLSDSMQGVERLLRLVSQKKLVTLVGCNRRFHPAMKKIKNLLDERNIGKVVAARVEFGQYLPDWHPTEDYRENYSARRDLGGGVILDAIHELDYIRWMLGEIRRVSCFAGKLSRMEIDTEDTASVLLQFESGAIGEVHVDYIQRAARRSCQIIGDEGTILWDSQEDKVRLYTAQTGGWEEFTNPPGWVPNDMYVEEMRHFLQCLEGKDIPMQDVFEAERILSVALAAKTSAATGCIVEIDATKNPQTIPRGKG